MAITSGRAVKIAGRLTADGGNREFVTAKRLSPEATAQAHLDAWLPSTFTVPGMRGACQTWPYRPGLHLLVEDRDGTLAASAA